MTVLKMSNLASEVVKPFVEESNSHFVEFLQLFKSFRQPCENFSFETISDTKHELLKTRRFHGFDEALVLENRRIFKFVENDKEIVYGRGLFTVKNEMCDISLRRTKENIRRVRGLFFDFDSGDVSQKTVLRFLSSISLPPTFSSMRDSTATKFHLYYIFNHFHDAAVLFGKKFESEMMEQCLADIIFKGCGKKCDKAVITINGLLRTPGSFHWKNVEKPEIVKIYTPSSPRFYSVEELKQQINFSEFLKSEQEKVEKITLAASTSTTRQNFDNFSERVRIDMCIRFVNSRRCPSKCGGNHNFMLYVGQACGFFKLNNASCDSVTTHFIQKYNIGKNWEQGFMWGYERGFST